MSESSCKIKLNDVSLVLGGNVECGSDLEDCTAFISAYNTIEGTAGADGTLPLTAVGASRNMTLSDNSVMVEISGVYSVSYTVSLNPRLNVSVALYRNGDVVDGSSQTSPSGVNAFSYSAVVELCAGDALSLMTDTPSAELGGETNVTLSLHKIN